MMIKQGGQLEGEQKVMPSQQLQERQRCCFPGTLQLIPLEATAAMRWSI